jgi:hypothetical protein
MNQSEGYIDKQKQLTLAVDCNFSYLLRGVPNLGELLKDAGFNSDYIEAIMQERSTADLQLVFYIPSFVKVREDVQVFETSIDEIINRDKYKDWLLIEHRNNLLLLVLLLHNYYFLDSNGNQIHRIGSEGLFNERQFDELPWKTQELIKGKDVAALLEILLQIRKKTSPVRIEIDKYQSKISNTGFRRKLADLIESHLQESSDVELGAALPLMFKYREFQVTKDDTEIRQIIKMINNAKITSPAPLYNVAVANFSLLIRNYLVCNGVPNTKPIWPKELLMFIEELLVLLNVDYESSPGSIKKLRTIIKDYIKGHQIDLEEIVM